jgi:parallel beta-helix repeat protein
MSKREKLIVFMIIGLILPLLINTNSNFIKKSEYPKIKPKTTSGYTAAFIHIDGNWTGTTSFDWCSGDGSKNNPYLIENVTIDASNSPTGNGIFINNSKNEYFMIRNCTILNAVTSFFDSGIWLENTNNGTILNNTCSDNNQGIYLVNCKENNITGNIINNNVWSGLYLDTNSDYNNITWNLVNQNEYGIQLETDCNYNNISLNIVNNNDYGIYINSFGGASDNNIIFNNTVNENNINGIYIRYNNNRKNSVINNTVNDNGGVGILIQDSIEFNVYGNKIKNNILGLYLQNCKDGNITRNTINSNFEVGIYLYYNSDNNQIKNNTINKNDLGVRLDDSNYNNITGNTLKDNNWCIFETNCEGNIIEYNDCTSPTVELPIYIDDYETGFGAHNWTWAENQAWCTGLGTPSDPYIIENLKISGFGTQKYGIDIRNSNVSFIIRNCLIYSANEAGIYLDNVNNSRLINNNCSNNDNGIMAEYSNDITIYENILNSNEYDGIFIYESTYVNITRNVVNNNDGNGIYINICNFSYIIENIVNGNDQNGIYLEECFMSTIYRNEANNNYDGIFLWNFCYNITILGNNVNENDDGIHLEQSDFNEIFNNTAYDNSRAGIYLSSSDYNRINDNSVSGSYDGIYFEDECFNNTIEGNILNGNNEGLYLYYSDFNQIIENTMNNNNFLGIGLETSYHNTILKNTVNNNKITGIDIDDDSDYNILSENILKNNTLGLDLHSFCGNNSIYKNLFLKNGVHAKDDGSDNKWNSSVVGNYWDNHTGPDISPEDGIVDTPYTYIGGSAGSIDYLPIAEDGAPRITINSPTEGSRFSSAPSFNVEIIDDFLYEMWYTIDGGLNNYTFTENGTIDESAWDALPDGTVIITFYARDIPGYEAFEQVTVIKGIAPGGLEPWVIALIVVFSVIGGIALIGVGYFYFKKRDLI